MDQKIIKQTILQVGAESGEYLRHHFYTFKNVFRKDVGSIVTNVDLELTEIIIRRLFVRATIPAAAAENRKPRRKEPRSNLLYKFIWSIPLTFG